MDLHQILLQTCQDGFRTTTENVAEFDTEGMEYKECAPPGQMVNGKFYFDVLRQLRAKNLAQTSRPVALQLLGPAS